ncbi:hypothetical protein D8B23_11950 [Verminephrobacter aporrectodeae subsp. tuberculatae]|uniref:AMP-binding protein n=1 Tax=Verminephrobacter aporrectodeae TaxID=1110389 RepID=UPI002242F21E|nr:AMP-binding protein [Verminephrobacter aporrectodeae]MCW8199119.1 hypothetical protein [Verminephrobacter aporrectodeae subsp. tuberculatae]
MQMQAGSARLDPEIQRQFQDRFAPLTNIYGLSECGFAFLFGQRRGDRFDNSVGPAVGLELRLLDAHGRRSFGEGDAVDLLRPATQAALLAGASLVLMSNVVHLLGEAERATIYGAIRKHAAGPVGLVVYDQFLADAAPADGRLTASDLMVVDWLKCGIPFDHTAQRIGEEIVRHGFATSVRNAVGLPGRFVVARASLP